MARSAVIFAVTLSLFLLSHARLDPPSDAVAVAVQDPESSADQVTALTTVILPIHRLSSIPTVDPDDLARQISHSFRLPLDGRFRRFGGPASIHLRRGCGHAGLARHHVGGVVEIPYGNDMLPARRSIDRKFRGEKRPLSREEFRRVVQNLGFATTEAAEIKAAKAKTSGFMERIREFLNRF